MTDDATPPGEPNQIKAFFHCAKCMPDRPPDLSPREWVQLEAGFTKVGVQVWCKRCELNVIHIDFQGGEVTAR